MVNVGYTGTSAVSPMHEASASPLSPSSNALNGKKRLREQDCVKEPARAPQEHSFYDKLVSEIMAERLVSQRVTPAPVSAGKAQPNLAEIAKIWSLPDVAGQATRAQRIWSDANDVCIFKVFLNDVPHAARVFPTDVQGELVQFHRALQKVPHEVIARTPGAAAVVHVAKPVGRMQIDFRNCSYNALVFNWVSYAREVGTLEDKRSLKKQLHFIHSLGFVNLEITRRTVLLSDTAAFLMSYDCVCGIGKPALFPLPPESSRDVLRGQVVTLADDDHLWNLLKAEMFPNTASAAAGSAQSSSSALTPAGYRAGSATPTASSSIFPSLKAASASDPYGSSFATLPLTPSGAVSMAICDTIDDPKSSSSLQRDGTMHAHCPPIAPTMLVMLVCLLV